MACWIYKCNGRQHPYQVAYGDWDEFFSSRKADQWGSTEWVPDLARLEVGDSILAYQTDRNELVGVATVRGWRSRKSFQDLILRPDERIGAKVRPLKQADNRIAKIPALQPGPIKTIYEITLNDARRLVAAAGGDASSLDGATSKAQLSGGTGFGIPEQNEKVESDAIRASEQPKTSFTNRRGLSLRNVEDARTLLAFIEDGARATTRKGSRRHMYVLSCYFDLEALRCVTKAIRERLNERGGDVVGLTVAVDVAEWIRSRSSVDDLVSALASAIQCQPSLVRVVPVNVPSRLLHAKAYAAIGPGESTKNGFVIVTSGNATQRGLGLDSASNFELAMLSADPADLRAFEAAMAEILSHEVSPEKALKQDEFLQGLALLSSGVFFHRWQGSLAAEVRFKLSLTEAGKEALKAGAARFRRYDRDSDTMSYDPLDIERVFKRVPKPFPRSFWKTYAVDTLLGVWMPRPIADVVQRRLDEDVSPYVNEIGKRTSEARVDKLCERLETEVKEFAKRGEVAETSSIISTWRERVKRFRENTDLIRLRVHRYQRVPDLLDSENRQAVLETVETVRSQLSKKQKLDPTKSIVARFLAGELRLRELDSEFKLLARKAAALLRTASAERAPE